MRRHIGRFDRDQRVVKTSLVAAAVALCVGFYAQTEMRTSAQNATSVAEKTAEVRAVEDDKPAQFKVVQPVIIRVVLPASISS